MSDEAYSLLINGQLVDTEQYGDVIDPATAEAFARVPLASPGQLEDAVQAASNAFRSWKFSQFSDRQNALLQVAEVLRKNEDQLSRLLVHEQGKALSAAVFEVQSAVAFCEHIAGMQLDTEVLLDTAENRIEIHRKPLGVVACITPWNFPLLISVYKLCPAVLAGNSVILKPAPTTPLTALALGKLIKNVFPPGVVNVIADDNDLGKILTEHPQIQKISFTGSTPTGKAIMAAAAPSLKRLTLELGGNDAAIILDDVDPLEVAESVFGAAFINSGQTCIAIKRLYVPDSLYDSVCEAIGNIASRTEVASGLTENAMFGPVQNAAQYARVCSYIDDARTNGRIIAGGNVPEIKGFFVPITVVRDIEDGTRLVDEEQFGPILPIIRYTDIDDAIERVNAAPYALGGSVWTSDIQRGQEIAARLESGTVWINQHCVFGPHIPFPTAKESGIGVEFAQQGLEEYTQMQVVNIRK